MHPVGMGFDFIMIVPFLPSLCGLFFVFGRGLSFFDGFQCLLVSGGSTASCDIGGLAEGDEHTSFYPATLNQSLSVIS